MKRTRMVHLMSSILGLCLLLTTMGPTAAARNESTGLSPIGRGQAASGPTRMLAAPAVSASQIAFVYAGDLWVADLAGRDPRRLTANGGVQATLVSPSFSPDGRWLAFSATLHNNLDVYVVPSTGGEPRRLTWHSADDLVQGFSPDGRAVIFVSDREAKFYTDPYVYSVPLEGGLPKRLVDFNVSRAAYSADGKSMAFNSLDDAFLIWKGYRGGQVSVITIYRFDDGSTFKIPQPETRCNDVEPMWIGDNIYFRSDRDGEFNLYSYDPNTREVAALTDHRDFPVVNASGRGTTIAYEQAGRLHLYDLSLGKSTPLDIRIATDLPETRERFVKGVDLVRGADVSPTGARAVFEMRGEIVTVPAEKGDPRNLTNSPGANDRSPAWSPDGKQIAYFSDASGKYELVIRNQDGSGELRRFSLTGAGYYDLPTWSPQGDLIAFIDNAGTLFSIDVENGEQHQIASASHFDPTQGVRYTWAPDGNWLAYTQTSGTGYQELFLYSFDKDQSYAVSDGLADVSQPSFDAGGQYLYFRTSTNSGPLNADFDMSALGARETDSIYLAVLARDGISPLARQSDEETPADQSRTAGPGGSGGAAGPDNTPQVSGTVTVTIDVEGLQARMIPLPIAAAPLDQIQTGVENQVYYLKLNEGTPEGQPPTGKLMHFDLKTRKESSIQDGVRSFAVSGDGSKILADTQDGWAILDATGAGDSEPKKLDLDAVQIRVEPRAEWKEMFEDAWRINRDYFYDPGMQGVDWNAMREKYATFLPDLATRSDLNRLLRWLLSELRVSHHQVDGGDIAALANPISVGLLGADYTVENGRYRFAKVYDGFTWYPRVMAPLGEPGSEVKAGEYLLAVNGQPLTSHESIYHRFEDTVDKTTQITVGADPNGSGARTLTVVPIDDESTLRKLAWIEGNRLKVDKASGGRIAYVYMPDTGVSGYNLFKRYFFPASDKSAIIVDDRFNEGGQYADYVMDLLQRRPVAWYEQRYGGAWRVPGAYIAGPKVMLINEGSASGGDLMPWTFRKLGLGTLIGTRTWGGLVGLTDFPPLVDGGSVTAPNLGFFDDQGWIVENVGVQPDIEVEQIPAEIQAGKDPQLERAITYLLEALKAHPLPEVTPPAFPDKTK